MVIKKRKTSKVTPLKSCTMYISEREENSSALQKPKFEVNLFQTLYFDWVRDDIRDNAIHVCT